MSESKKDKFDLKRGYFKVLNSLEDAILLAGLSKNEHLAYRVIFRKSFGTFGQKEWPEYTPTRLANSCGMNRANATRAVQNLINRNIVVKTTTGEGVSLRINKYFDEWVDAESVAKQQRGVAWQNNNQSVAKQQPKRGKTTTPIKSKEIRNKKGEKGFSLKAQNSKKSEPDLPSFIDPEVWRTVIQHRRENRWSVTPTWQARQFKEFAKWHADGADVNQELLDYVRVGWQGIFRQNKSNQQNAKGKRNTSRVEQDLESGAEWLRQQGITETDA